MNLTAKSFGKGKIVVIFTIVFCAIFNLKVYGAGELDSTFTASAFGSFNGNVNVIKVQPDGKILVGGFFTEINGFAASGIGRLNVDGTVDTSFKSPDIYSGVGLGSTINAIAIQSDGKILIGGSYLGVSDDANTGVRRLNQDGSLDTSFVPVSFFLNSIVNDLKIQADGKIIVGGSFQLNNSFNIIRLNTDGSVDNTFTPFSSINPVAEVAIQTDGKIIVGGGSPGFVRRLNTNGSIDNSFSPIVTDNGVVNTVKIRSDGKVLVGGSFTAVNGFLQGRLSLINSDGSIDLTFNQNNPGANGAISDLELKSDGKILIGGGFSTFNSTARVKIAQLNADGSIDMSYVNNVTLSLALVNDIEYMADGRVLAGINPQTGISSITRYTIEGILDTTFAVNINRSGRVRKLLQQPDGKILVGGTFTLVNNVKRNYIARINADGSLDNTFVPFINFLTTIQNVSAIALQPDGKILFGTEINATVRRMNADGSEDTSFSTSVGGNITDLAVLPNGQILVSNNSGIRRLNANGAIDSTFGNVQPNGLIQKFVVMPDGKIMIGGDFTQIGATLRGRIARLNADSSLDNTFNPPGGANSTVYAIAIQADGKVVIGGAFTALNGSSNQVRLGRLNADGSLDSGFVQNTNGAVLTIKIEPNGKILIGGSLSSVQSTPHNGIARLNSNGTIDGSFNTFANTTVWDIQLQPDGKIIVGGEFTKLNRLSAVRIGRLLNASAPIKTMFDYDGDGKADVSVFRPSENRWYIFRSSDGVITQTAFAITDDKPVPADFDGDGKTDIAIFRASGDWWSLSSSNNAQITANLGNALDIKLPSDFDGDGRADYIIFRPSNNTWYRLSSATGMSSNLIFGLAGDKPVSGDFDGDGKSDVAIYRPSTGDWWYQSSINGAQLATRWGIASDIPTPADFDGDGKTDFAVYRASTGVWYIYNSSTGNATIMAFGLAEDKPIAADYDGDGKADIAVFRPSTGIWYLMRSTAGFTALQFGISTDIPTPNAFVP